MRLEHVGGERVSRGSGSGNPAVIAVADGDRGQCLLAPGGSPPRSHGDSVRKIPGRSGALTGGIDAATNQGIERLA
jgi:hypothetical protein